MRKIIEYLSKNKEWLFSGLGILLLVTIIGFVGKLIGIYDKKGENVIQPSSKIQDQKIESPRNSPINSDKLSPSKIMETIDQAPLLQQSEIVKHYIGLKVTWQGYLIGIVNIGNNNCRISIKDKDFGTYIGFEINSIKHPGLGLLKYGDILKVEGKIKNIDTLWIYLSDVKIVP
jgi:hypothetical protein